MKRYILILALMATTTYTRNSNYQVIHNVQNFHDSIQCQDGLTVALFYSPTCFPQAERHRLQHACTVACDNGNSPACKNAKQKVILNRKQGRVDWCRQGRYLEKMFRETSAQRPGVTFAYINTKYPSNQSIARQYNVPLDQPTYALFKDGKPFNGAAGRKLVNMENISSSPLYIFVMRNFGDFLKECRPCPVVYDEFNPEPIRSFSVWDWGGPFMHDALYPYSGVYYAAMLA